MASFQSPSTGQITSAFPNILSVRSHSAKHAILQTIPQQKSRNSWLPQSDYSARPDSKKHEKKYEAILTFFLSTFGILFSGTTAKLVIKMVVDKVPRPDTRYFHTGIIAGIVIAILSHANKEKALNIVLNLDNKNIEQLSDDIRNRIIYIRSHVDNPISSCCDTRLNKTLYLMVIAMNAFDFTKDFCNMSESLTNINFDFNKQFATELLRRASTS